MFGINEILAKVFFKKALTEEEKFKILHSERINPEVIEYLMQKLNDLYIEVLDDYDGNLFQLMAVEKLIGWCWETTESAIVFLNDDDYIERGILYIDENTPNLFHSWICFSYNGVEYTFDPCLNLLCKKAHYSKIFKTNVKGRVLSKDVKEELIRHLTVPKEETSLDICKNFEGFMRNKLGESYDKIKEKLENEIIVHGPEDVNTPFYRNGSGYRAKLENGKIKKLTVHYYYSDC